ncbi:structural maintenance of chromosomes flexible hinge domain-containing protein GMI1-like [Pistacia vera]|uniref:structural maintenance of chromosomes flexible hinge domain-containing protein GMI1-like n=1 Tax=Pistacia vera TaxID=55513 RepID=UPI0012636750|nr:structural maintenance of chromosomes flexible hinge domain-containing protein GMI1-like [Pistacia vera]
MNWRQFQFHVKMFDTYSNHVNKGVEVELNLDGFRFEDQLGIKRKVDDYGCVDLSGLLKVTVGYGKSGSSFAKSKNGVL